jgi:hypothetical protein
MRLRGSRPTTSEAPPLPPGGEYATISVGCVWGVASLLLFAASLMTRQLVGFLPPHLQGYYLMPPLVVRLTPLIALIGLLVGMIGVRRKTPRSLALLGAGLNVVVVLLSSLFFIGFW